MRFVCVNKAPSKIPPLATDAFADPKLIYTRPSIASASSPLTRVIYGNGIEAKMSSSTRPTSRQTILPSQHTRTGSINTSQSALQARINEKKSELESLKQLRDLSAGLAGQMQQLEDKLSTLSDGTEAVAAVMGNWNTVLRAIYMASQQIPKPKEEGKEDLPHTLVRIPIQQAEAAQREQEKKQGEAGE